MTLLASSKAGVISVEKWFDGRWGRLVVQDIVVPTVNIIKVEILIVDFKATSRQNYYGYAVASTLFVFWCE